MWNSLPSKIKAITSFRSFTKSVKASLLDTYLRFRCLSLRQVTIIISSFPFLAFSVFIRHYVVMLYCSEFIHSIVNWLAIPNGDIYLLYHPV